GVLGRTCAARGWPPLQAKCSEWRSASMRGTLLLSLPQWLSPPSGLREPRSLEVKSPWPPADQAPCAGATGAVSWLRNGGAGIPEKSKKTCPCTAEDRISRTWSCYPHMVDRRLGRRNRTAGGHENGRRP